MDILKHLYSQKSEHTDGLNQEEREAILDLLLFAVYADNHLSLAEDRIIKNEVERLQWESGTSIDYYVDEATGSARAALSSETREAQFLESIQTRLKSPEARNRALSLLSKLFYSDGETREERNFAQKIRQLLA
ncbi:hypothetical protein [Puniceicoccus vermicola]|uniref:TerB family tellurite resistance protein n=1 Tax=Puniceicoccus vermicola TaxID=388746 RepID=A0A7X1AZ85_9BACT|nr:hypothetical protein [Puniceicoccus vermicola]MBC2602499.1 hypothetical protein [Puniceicoccus vermicola]